ncbi:MAG: ion transporter, partial [Chloroflexi bacterium]|nr:ion transporter [Chloroflexota bacterium]
IVGALVRSIPSVANIMMLMSIVVYIYAIVGYHLFHEADPTHWRTLGISLLSLFRIITLEDWTDIMYAAMEHHGLAWLYFLSFVVGGTFVVANLFIAVVINNLDKAKVDELKALETPPSREELLRELRTTQETLRRLEDRLTGYGGKER